ncbi:MAG: hypothetical protein ACE5HG_00825 [Candidatus Bathyarchaeia archaeon]
MELELFIVSAVYWGCVLIVSIWLSRRLSALRKRLADLEKGGN